MKKYLFICSFFLNLVGFSQNHPIGHTTIDFQDPERGNRQIETEIYYPATAAGNDTPALNGDFPVIVFGHGFVMAWSAYENLWAEFVPRGYIMAFPRTEGNAFSTDHQEFGWDLEFLVTAMQQEGNDQNSILYDVVAPETALMGHSMGGGAAFLAADSLCNNGNQNLKTLIGLAPAESNSNGVSSIASATEVTVPSFILSGVQDGVTPPVDHHIPMYDNLASDCKTILHITGGAHCYFANSNFNCDFGEGTSSTGISITRQEQHDITFDFVNLWLDYTLKANCNDFAIFNDSLNTTPRATYDQVCSGPITFESTTTATICNGDTYTFPDGTTGSTATIHTSNLSSVGGCDSIIETTLAVQPSYQLAESAVICNGDIYTFPDGTTSSSATTHSSILTSSTGCDSIVETTLNITNLDAGVTNNNGQLEANQTGASYQWIDCSTMNLINGETGQALIPTTSGNYAVEITENGCIEISDCYEVQVSGLESLKDKVEIEIYPNPSNGFITIHSPLQGEIQIIDMTGKLVREIHLENGTKNILLDADSGVYTWRFVIKKGDVSFGRLVIEK
jgi:predicted dienelactone hydrolase